MRPTWSLSVEWQFDLIDPVCLALAWTRAPKPSPLRLMVWIGCGLSSALCIFLPSSHQSAAFSWLPPRAWEMLAGGLVALHPVVWSRATIERALQIGSLAVPLFCVVAYRPWPSDQCVVLTALW